MNTIGKPRGFWPTFVSFPRACLLRRWTRLVYRHVSTTWDEPSPEEKKGLWGSKLLLLVTPRWLNWNVTLYQGKAWTWTPLHGFGNLCTFSNVHNTALIQSFCSFGDATTWYLNQVHLPIFNTLHFTLSVGGRRYHVIWLNLFLIHLKVHQFLEKQLQPFTNLRSWIMENPIYQVFQTHFPTPFHVFPTTFLLWGTNSPRKKETRSETY